MITAEDMAAPGINMSLVSEKVDELVGGKRRLTVVLQGEYVDESLKDAVLVQLTQEIRLYAGEFSSAVIAAMRGANERVQVELTATKRQLAQEQDLRAQAELRLEGYEHTLAEFGQALRTG
jgi:hypothetical protein